MARTVNAEVIASTFDEPAERHVKNLRNFCAGDHGFTGSLSAALETVVFTNAEVPYQSR